MICATQDVSGAITVVVPQPSVVDSSTCPLVVTIYEDAFKASMLSLSAEQGGQVGAAILFVWGVAYAFRIAIKALSIGDDDEKSGS